MQFTEKYEGVTDRTGWPEGPWDGEPDKVVWVDPETGLDCMARRGGGGAWCGYVGVKPGHPWWHRGYSSCTLVPPCEDAGQYAFCDHTPESLTDVHGGLTFAAACHDDGDPAEDICHVSDEPVWWFGFDTAHAGDLTPRTAAMLDLGEPPLSYTYKTLGYVIEETTRLAEQVAAA